MPGGAPPAFVDRPFEGLPSECDMVAMRELVPAATAPLTLTGETPTAPCGSASLLPMAAPAMVRDSGEVWLGLQVQHNFGDPARDLGAVLLAALEAEPGMVGLTDPPGEGPRLQDLVDGRPPRRHGARRLRLLGRRRGGRRTSWPRPSSRPTAPRRRRPG